jgi:GT2 family glycosyltransferase
MPYVSHLLTKNESLKLLLKWEFHGCSLLIPKTAFYDVGFFDENLITTQDFDLWFKFIKEGYQFYCLAEIVMITRFHDQQGTAQKWDISKYEQLKLWKDVKKLIQKDLTLDDKEIKSLIRDKILLFKKAVREGKFP